MYGQGVCAHEEARGRDEEKRDVRAVRVKDRGLLALQCPKMRESLQCGVTFDVNKLPFMSTVKANVFDIDI
jgi:hypothetical protein